MYTRFKLALTEENPLVVVYNETLWSELYDAKTAPVEDSLILLDGLHRRWVRLLRSMSDEDYKKSFVHPNAGAMPLDRGVGAYSWHTRHHTAQIIELRKRRDW
jgi:hypothetical protein